MEDNEEVFFHVPEPPEVDTGLMIGPENPISDENSGSGETSEGESSFDNEDDSESSGESEGVSEAEEGDDEADIERGLSSVEDIDDIENPLIEEKIFFGRKSYPWEQFYAMMMKYMKIQKRSKLFTILLLVLPSLQVLLLIALQALSIYLLNSIIGEIPESSGQVNTTATYPMMSVNTAYYTAPSKAIGDAFTSYLTDYVFWVNYMGTGYWINTTIALGPQLWQSGEAMMDTTIINSNYSIANAYVIENVSDVFSFKTYEAGIGMVELVIGLLHGRSLMAVGDYCDAHPADIACQNIHSNSFINDYGIVFSSLKTYPRTPLDFDFEAIINLLFGVIGIPLYIIMAHVLLPFAAHALIYEKQEQTLILTRMMGIQKYSVVFSYFCYYYGNYFIMMVLLIIVGSIGNLTFFSINCKIWLLLFFLSFGYTVLAMAYSMTLIFGRRRVATLVGMIYIVLVAFFSIQYVAISDAFALEDWVNWSMMIIPSMAFAQGCFMLFNHTVGTGDNLRGSGIDCFDFEVPTLNNIGGVTILILIEGTVIIVVTYYLSEIFPGKWGVRKNIFYPIMDIVRRIIPKNYEKFKQKCLDGEEGRDDPGDVKAERKRVFTVPFDDGDMVIRIMNVNKVYGRMFKSGFTACNDVSFGINRGEIFGLLGPNGAGKTTVGESSEFEVVVAVINSNMQLISILCGIFSATSGEAFLNGYNVVTRSDKVREYLGICTQFDNLWEKLTASETLHFYGRVRGLKLKKNRLLTKKMLQYVGLDKKSYRRMKVGSFSGGMKRRLSVACAFMGNPRIVILDEPTTGLDPEVKRAVWDLIVDRVRLLRCTVLITTHSLEEADAICDRIGIMTRGKLMCVGTKEELKKRYAGGFNLEFHTRFGDEGMENAVDFFDKKFGPGVEPTTSFGENYVLKIPRNDLKLSNIIEIVESNADKLFIDNWGISSNSLNAVFRKIVEIDEADID